MSRLTLILTALLAVSGAGCAVGPDERPLPSQLDPVEALRALPTPPGLVDVAAARPLDAAGVATELFSDPSVAGRVTDQGLLRAAVRRWRWSTGGEMVAVVAVWNDRQVARGLSGQAAELLLADGGTAWTPGDLAGSRGSFKEGDGGTDRRLARAVVQDALFVRASGGVTAGLVEQAVRRLSLLSGARREE